MEMEEIGEGIDDRLRRSALNLPYEINLSTRRNNPIPNSVILSKDPRIYLLRRAEFERGLNNRTRLLIKVLGDGDDTYNCAGMVFGTRRAFIHVDQVNRILEDDSYELVDSNDVQAGDIAIWRNDEDENQVDHVGLVAQVDIEDGMSLPIILSKWGNGMDIAHPPLMVPHAYGCRIEYWRVNRNDHP